MPLVSFKKQSASGGGGGDGSVAPDPNGLYKGEATVGQELKAGDLVTYNNCLFAVTQDVTVGYQDGMEFPLTTGNWSGYFDEVVQGHQSLGGGDMDLQGGSLTNVNEVRGANSLFDLDGDPNTFGTNTIPVQGAIEGVNSEHVQFAFPGGFSIYGNTLRDGSGAWDKAIDFYSDNFNVITPAGGQILHNGNPLGGGGGGQTLVETVIATDGSGDYTTINEAVAAGKYNLYLRNGTHKLTANLNMNQTNASIRGESRMGAIISGQDAGYSISLPGNGFSLTDLTINAGTTYGLFVDVSGYYGHIDNVLFTTAGSRRLIAFAGGYNRLTNCRFVNTTLKYDVAIYVNGSNHIIANNRFDLKVNGSGDGAIRFAAANSVLFANNQVSNTGNDGAQSMCVNLDSSNLISIVGNWFSCTSTSGAVNVSSSANVLIESNHIYAPQTFAVKVTSSVDASIIGNQIHSVVGSSSVAIDVSGSSNANIQSNTIVGTATTGTSIGVRLAGTLSHTIINGNRIRNFATGFVTTAATVTQTNVVGNVLAGNGAVRSDAGSGTQEIATISS